MDYSTIKRTSRLKLAAAVKKARGDAIKSVSADQSVIDISETRTENVPSLHTGHNLDEYLSETENDDDDTGTDLGEYSGSDDDTTSQPEILRCGESETAGMTILDILSDAQNVNSDGWKIRDVCSLILYTAKSAGVADTVLDKFMGIFALICNVPRHASDMGSDFPKSYHRLKTILNIDPLRDQRIVYICPSTPTGKRKGEYQKVEERCGCRLRESREADVFVCDACSSQWDRKHVDKDGNHFVTVPVHSILKRTMARFGKYSSPLPVNDPSHPTPQSTAVDVTDGQRFRDMQLSGSDLAFMLHSDGAEIVKSTQKKMYLTFIQCINVPLHIRAWYLQSVWVGQHLVKDRECFLIELSKQLQEVQPGNPNYHQIDWTDSFGVERHSDAYPLAYLGDTPERSALNGQLPHGAGRACIYCLQISKCINHRMCYEYVEDAELKTHADVIAQAAIWENSSHIQRTEALKTHATKGFKRPSVISKWKNFDMVKGFALDVMHQFDEGVAKFFLDQLLDRDTILNTWKRAPEMDRSYLAMVVPGHHNRQLRSLKQWKSIKARELRFLLQHALPVIVKGIVPKHFYKVFCLASNIAYLCTQDSISSQDVADLKNLCHRFMTAFQASFGVAEMKFSIHLVSHLWYAVELYGPLQNISCYGPEDMIGKISRKVRGLNNTTKHIMNCYTTLSQVSDMLDSCRMDDRNTDYRVLNTLARVQNKREGHFSLSGPKDRCTMTGRPLMLDGDKEANALLLYHLSQFCGQPYAARQVFQFARVRVEAGIYVRSLKDDNTSSRNESIVMNDDNVVLQVTRILAVVNELGTEVVDTFVYGMKMTEPEIEEIFQ